MGIDVAASDSLVQTTGQLTSSYLEEPLCLASQYLSVKD
jgi:hypothetical protein